jgi:hypothetical protein
MKYTPEIAQQIVLDYERGIPVQEIADEINVPKRSVISKLSSLGVYKRKTYVNKCGETPIKKEEYIERIGRMLNIDLCLLDSMEKVTKTALILLDKQIQEILSK